MTTEETYHWELTAEVADQKGNIKPRLKARDGYMPSNAEIDAFIDKFTYFGNKLVEKGFKVATQ